MSSRRTSLAAIAVGVVGSLAVAIAPAHAVEPPTGLRVTGSGFNAIAIAWDPVPGAFGYRVDYATNPNFSGLVKETTRSTARVLKNGAKGLLPATMYYFRVMVIDANLTPVSPPSPTVSHATKPAMKFVVASYNVKDPDSSGVRPWTWRCPLIGRDIVKLAIRVVGVQEVFEDDERQDLLDCVNRAAGGQHYSMTPGPGSSAGQDSRIVFDERVFNHVSSGGKSFAYQNGSEDRAFAWGIFQYRPSGRHVLFLTTHLSPRSDYADVRQWKELLGWVRWRVSTYGVPLSVIITGDFNTTKFEPPASMLAESRSAGYEDVLGQIRNSYSTYRNPSARVDAWISTSNRNKLDLRQCGCLVSTDRNANSIDYIFVSRALKALYYRTYAQPRLGYVMGYLLSDHFMALAVIAE